MYYKCDCNHDFVRLTSDPENRTHLGRVSLEVMQEIKKFRKRAIVENSERRRFFDLTVDGCNWISNIKIQFVAEYFKRYIEKSYNLALFKCPVKKGLYILAETREQITSTDILPKFLPSRFKDNFTIQSIFTTTVNRITFAIQRKFSNSSRVQSR